MTETIRRPPTPAEPDPTTEKPNWGPLVVLMCGTFMFVLDFFIVNVALPSIQAGLKASAGSIEMVVAGYGLTTAAVLITGGRLGDIIGRRKAFSFGLGLFVAMSAACAAAPDVQVLIAGRLLQGIAAGLMAPNILSILGVVYPGPARVKAISIYGMVMGLAAAAGQIIGGLLIRSDVLGLGWRSIFWINLPIGVAALVAAPRLIPESRDGTTKRLDPVGVVTLTAALIAVILPLVEGRQQGWPIWSFASLAASPVLFAVFVVSQRRRAATGHEPLLSPAVFSSRALVAGLSTQLVFWCQQAASYLFLALYLQEGRGMSPLASGGVFTALAAGYLATSLRAPALTARYGRKIVLIGALVAAAGDVALLAAVDHVGVAGSIAFLVPGLFLMGAGQGLCITPLTAIVLGQARPETAGSVSGALSTMQQMGNAIGVAISGVVFYGALHSGYATAYERALAEMALLLVGVAAITARLLAPPTREPAPVVEPSGV
ncbi:MAG TPA: MFS transporter [Acidimicrobiales bacterium]|jgi:EmrB/QacA subfamily drug resistance transporter|nr:MFS transporter [Acidimicrobiales bacterium]